MWPSDAYIIILDKVFSRFELGEIFMFTTSLQILGAFFFFAGGWAEEDQHKHLVLLTTIVGHNIIALSKKIITCFILLLD